MVYYGKFTEVYCSKTQCFFAEYLLCFTIVNIMVYHSIVGILANTPGGVKRSGLGAHACWVISHV